MKTGSLSRIYADNISLGEMLLDFDNTLKY